MYSDFLLHREHIFLNNFVNFFMTSWAGVSRVFQVLIKVLRNRSIIVEWSLEQGNGETFQIRSLYWRQKVIEGNRNLTPVTVISNSLSYVSFYQDINISTYYINSSESIILPISVQCWQQFNNFLNYIYNKVRKKGRLKKTYTRTCRCYKW